MRINVSMKKALLLFALCLAIFPASVYGLGSCRTILVRHLKQSESSDAKTVTFEGLDSNGDVVLKTGCRLLNTPSWNSHYRPDAHPYSPQGDPRWPIALFGRKLAAQMGFRIHRSLTRRSYTLRAPGAEKFGRLVRLMNQNLIREHLEPITVLPVAADYVTNAQLLQLAISRDGPILMKVPYDDHNPSLTPHEEAYHLGVVVYPKRLVKRAVEVTKITHDFAELLSQRDPELGSTVGKQIETNRALWLDAGQGNVAMLLGKTRLAYNMQSYQKVFDEDPADERRLGSFLDLFAWFQMQPVDVLLMQLHYLTGVEVDDLLITKTAAAHFRPHLPAEESSKRFLLSAAQRATLNETISDFLEAYTNSPNFKLYDTSKTPTEHAREFIKGLDERLAELSNALGPARR